MASKMIVSLTTKEQLEQVQHLETEVWGIPPIPTHQTLTTIKNGGIMVGMFKDEELIGFSYGFPGFKNGEIFLCSHMLGIHPDYRSKGLGEQIKQYQRQVAIEKGYKRMQWTFDPLETRNAYLNLTKLNGVCYVYVENCYGEMKDGLNKGLPSDRFELHWHVTSSYVKEKQIPNIEHKVAINQIVFNKENMPIFRLHEDITDDAPAYTMDVPKDFQRLKAMNQQVAMDWRLQTRKQFQQLFNAGYAAVRLIPYENYSQYVFVKKDTLQLEGE